MKSIILSLVACLGISVLGLTALADSTISLSPGSEATVEAGERTTVRCEGSSSSGRKVVCSYNNGYVRVTLLSSGQVIGGVFDHSTAGMQECSKATRVSANAFCSYMNGYVRITGVPSGATQGGTFDHSTRGLNECLEAIRD